MVIIVSLLLRGVSFSFLSHINYRSQSAFQKMEFS